MVANRITKLLEMYQTSIPYKVLTDSVDIGKELWIVWLETKISSNLLKESKKTLCLFSLQEAVLLDQAVRQLLQKCSWKKKTKRVIR